MSFLPLAAGGGTAEDGRMHPYAIDRMVEERRQELHRLSRLDIRRPGLWRRRAARALAGLAVAVAVPAHQRPASRGRLDAALGFEPPC
jgi:hypothetical protein